LTMEHRASASSLPGSDWSGHETKVYRKRAFFADADELAVHGDHRRELRLRPAALRTAWARAPGCVSHLAALELRRYGSRRVCVLRSCEAGAVKCCLTARCFLLRSRAQLPPSAAMVA
jgi:hypothetical protein